MEEVVVIEEVGERIKISLGEKMTKDFSDKYPDVQRGQMIGANIINRILSQPGCKGLAIFNGINEKGEQSLVYTGVDELGNPLIAEYQHEGKDYIGIVCDRSVAPGTGEGGWWFYCDTW